MKPVISKRHILALALLALSFQSSAKEPESSEGESMAAALDADEAAKETENEDAGKSGGVSNRSDEHLQLLDRTGEITRQNLIDALPKGFILGAAAINVPDRYSENDQNFYAFPGFVYLGDRFFYLGDRASYNLIRGETFSFNVNARYRFTSLDPDDAPEFYSLEERNGQLEAGFGLNALTKFGFFTTRVNADVTGQSNGYLANFRWFLPYYRKGLLVMPVVGVSWYDSSFSNYYFGGVSPQESNPLLPAFDTGSTTALDAMFVVGYRFNPHWFVTGGAVYQRLGSNVEDSPVLLGRNETILFTALGYIWE
jgi:MipA family protein